jgi:hypothetical protein
MRCGFLVLGFLLIFTWIGIRSLSHSGRSYSSSACRRAGLYCHPFPQFASRGLKSYPRFRSYQHALKIRVSLICCRSQNELVAGGHIPSITTSALSRHTSSSTCLEVFSLNPKSFFCDQGSCPNRSMEPSQFHQPSIRSQPASGP